MAQSIRLYGSINIKIFSTYYLMAVSLGLEPRITVPKTVVMIHFTKRPLQCSYIIYFNLYQVGTAKIIIQMPFSIRIHNIVNVIWLYTNILSYICVKIIQCFVRTSFGLGLIDHNSWQF